MAFTTNKQLIIITKNINNSKCFNKIFTKKYSRKLLFTNNQILESPLKNLSKQTNKHLIIKFQSKPLVTTSLANNLSTQYFQIKSNSNLNNKNLHTKVNKHLTKSINGNINSNFLMKIGNKTSNPHIKCCNLLYNSTKLNFHDIVYAKEKFSTIKQRLDTNRLVLCSDFDYTLTQKFDCKGFELCTSVSVLLDSTLISDSFKKRNNELFEEYTPYETNLDIDEKLRQTKIIEWYTKNLRIIINEKLTKAKLREIAIEVGSKLKFRTKLDKLLEIVINKRIPFCVITAGLKDVVEELLLRDFNEQILWLKDNGLFTVFGNTLVFDEQGESVDYGELVTTFNKGEFIRDKVCFGDERNQFIMLGDHIWDADAINYFKGEKFRFGFANFSNEIITESIKYTEFQKRFDLFLLNDGSFDAIIKLLS